MLILGIETSCDETAASLVEVHPVKSRKAGTLKGLFDRVKNKKIKVLSNVVSSQAKIHAKYGGVVPSLAAREHVKNLPKVLNLALRQNTRYKMQDTDLIAVTAGPGLISSLLIGTAFAKTLAWKFKKPIVRVNHIEGHICSNWLVPVGEISNFPARLCMDKVQAGGQFPISKRETFPAMCLVVSGGHTQLILMKNFGEYKVIGETLDDAAGEAFDKIARILGLGYPGGPIISAIAEKIQNPNDKYQIKLPRPMLNSQNFDFSFAGLKTAVLYLDKDLKKKLNKNKLPRELISQIAAEAQQAIVDVLVSKTIKAAQKYGTKSIMLSGGVSANKLLRSELRKNAEQREIKYFQPPPEYTTDNAAMIALAGYFNRKSWHSDWKKVQADANWELT